MGFFTIVAFQQDKTISLPNMVIHRRTYENIYTYRVPWGIMIMMTSYFGVTERQDYWYWSNWSCSRAYDKFVSFSRESYREPELNRPFKLLTKSSEGSEHSSAGTSANSE